MVQAQRPPMEQEPQSATERVQPTPTPPPPTPPPPTQLPPDLRAVGLALAAWAGALTGFLCPGWTLPVTASAALGWLLVRRRRGRTVLVAATWLVAATAVGGSAMLRAEAVQRSPLADLAREHAFVTATVRISTDPRLRQGRFSDYVLVRATTLEVTGRGERHRSRVPVLLIAGEEWRAAELGSVVNVQGRTTAADGPDLAAVISTSRPPGLVAGPPGPLDAASVVRAGIREAVAAGGPEERSLVPALVVGDDQGMPAEVVESFQVAGLTHLLAVSGTNLTLVVGFLLVVARWIGVRARGLLVIGALGVVGFVLLARTEPSVVRAAAMGTVALLGMGANGRQRGVRALGVAVLVLLLLDPWLALSLGFVLSALATAGILFLAPPWRDALMRWLPRPVAEAVAVPLAAQLVCTPVVAAISDQVSLVAVVANMAAAPAVGPATVLGLVGGLLVLVLEPVGLVVGQLAVGCAWWIIAVATHSARLPTAAVEWNASTLSIVLLTVLCATLGMVLPRVLARRGWSVAVALVMLVSVVRPLPSPGWPPAGWVMVACDVGQGDGLVLNACDGAVVVVDAGPEPDSIDSCLDRLDVQQVPVVVLTHFHDDHVAGLPGVAAGREVGELLVSPTPDPPGGAAAVRSWAEDESVPATVPAFGATGAVGRVSWQVIGPARAVEGASWGEEGSAANNASLVLVAVVRGVRILLTGDIEPEAQELLDRATTNLRVDVLKVPHHGSRYQDPAFLAGLGARLAVVSAGEGNDYGHPAPETLAVLEDAGVMVRRTDQDGDVAVVLDDQDDLEVVTHG
jgi:competence protein ComEC